MEQINPVVAIASTRRLGERATDTLGGAFERSDDEHDRAQQWAHAMAAVMLMQQPCRMAPSGMSGLTWAQARDVAFQGAATEDAQAVSERQPSPTSIGAMNTAGKNGGNARVAFVTDQVQVSDASGEMPGASRQAAQGSGAAVGIGAAAAMTAVTATAGVTRMGSPAGTGATRRPGTIAAIKELGSTRVGIMSAKTDAEQSIDNVQRLLLRKRSARSDTHREQAFGATGISATKHDVSSEEAAEQHTPRQLRAALPLHLLQSLQAAPTSTGWTYQFRSWKGEHAVVVTSAPSQETAGFALRPGNELVEQRLREHDAAPGRHYRIDACEADGRRRPGTGKPGHTEHSEHSRPPAHEGPA